MSLAFLWPKDDEGDESLVGKLDAFGYNLQTIGLVAQNTDKRREIQSISKCL